MMYAIKTPQGYLKDFHTGMYIFVDDKTVRELEPQVTKQVKFIPASHLIMYATDVASCPATCKLCDNGVDDAVPCPDLG